MDARILEEFQYQLGDSRPYFFNYIISKYHSIHTYIKTPVQGKKFDMKEVFLFKCDKKTQKRVIKPPSKKCLKKLNELINDSNVNLIAIPIVLKNKINCKTVNRSAHSNVLIYNKAKKEIERIDFRKYHLDGFSLKLFIKQLTIEFLPKYIHTYDPLVKLAPEIDISVHFMKNYSDTLVQDVYPIFLISYIETRNKHSTLTSQETVIKTTDTHSEKLWKEYRDFLENLNKNCQTGLVENTETLYCYQPTSSKIKKYFIKRDIETCPENKEYDKLRKKCVTKGKTADINVLLDELASTNYSMSQVLTHLDSEVNVILGTVKFILDKYPQASFLIPRGVPLDKKNFKIGWNTKEIRLPPNLWETWKEAQFDPSIRFIIVFISLNPPEGGAHANLLFYDKSINEIERFDGLGQHINARYKIDEFDDRFSALLNQQTDIFNKPPKYFKPVDFCPKKFAIFQAKELDEIPGVDLRGNCAVWRLWYLHIRLSNPHLKRKQLVELAVAKLKQTAGNLHKYIKTYQKYLLKNMPVTDPSKS